MGMSELIVAHTDSGLRLARAVALQEGTRETNLVLSPLTLNIVLGMVTAGAKGKTEDLLLSFLGAKSVEELNKVSSHLISLITTGRNVIGGPRTSNPSGVWVDQSTPLNPSYAHTVQTVYRAEAKTVDFQTRALKVRDEVNAWTESVTHGLIKELLPVGSVDPLTRLILANALYFKGEWKHRFEVSDTKEGSFYPLRGEPILRVPFMTSQKQQFVSAFPGFKVLKLPYDQGKDERRFSMYWFLPDERDGLHHLSEKVLSDSEFINSHLPAREHAVGEFMIPKFKIDYGFEASGLLKQMGLQELFSGEADLTGMVASGGRDLYVSGIYKQAFIEVDEEGTEAAAAAGVVISTRNLPTRIDFVADHPFLFLIREDTNGVVLFVGHVTNPLLTA